MEEEKSYSANGQRNNVRPSMVMMTSKLLNVTEGMAAMNVRIAIGVFLCLILLVVNFVVNVVAYEFAKDNRVSSFQEGLKAFVDKETGQPLITPSVRPLIDQSTAETFKSLGVVRAGLFSSDVIGRTAGVCSSLPEKFHSYCDEDGHLYILLGAHDLVFAFSSKGSVLVPTQHVDELLEVMRSGHDELESHRSARALLQGGSDECICSNAVVQSGCTSGCGQQCTLCTKFTADMNSHEFICTETEVGENLPCPTPAPTPAPQPALNIDPFGEQMG